MRMKQSLFDAVGGLPTFQKVHKIFYDKIYAHEWLKEFFDGLDQQVIEDRQTAFMALKMGGDVKYPGRELPLAHRHMYITQELFDLRSTILKESLAEAGVSDDLAERWLKIDNTFNRQIVKDSMKSFYDKTWKYKERVIVPKP
jgi:hemoglobin